jgi:cytochrome c oxidase subunit 4
MSDRPAAAKFINPELRRHLRVPLITMIVLLSLLVINFLLGLFFIHGWAFVPEVLIAATMVAIVILFAMEALQDPPLTQLFAGLGFFWVAILFTLTMMDYATR